MYVPGDDVYSTYPLWQALEKEGQYIAVESRYKQAGDQYADPATGAKITRCRYVDAWENLLRYECVTDYKSFTIISRGPDLEMHTGDDITKE